MATSFKNLQLDTITTKDLNDAMSQSSVDVTKLTGANKIAYDKYVAAAKANDAKLNPSAVTTVPPNLKLGNITTKDLNAAMAASNVNPDNFTPSEKIVYDKYSAAAKANDLKTSPIQTTPATSDSPAKNDSDPLKGFTPEPNASQSANAVSDLNRMPELNSLLLEEAKNGVRILQQKADEVNKPLQETYDTMKGIYDTQDAEFQKKYDAQWSQLTEYENKTKEAIAELDVLGRKQYKDYVNQVARTISGRKSAVAGDLSAQGFNTKVIGNITSQIESQYADEKLKVNTFLQDTLNNTLTRYKDLYTDLYNRGSSLTSAEQSFKTGLAERYKSLFDLKNTIATNNNSVLAPVESLNKAMLEAYAGVATSTATSAAYEAQWKQSDENQKIAALSSQLHSFMGGEKKADGTSKYDTASIPTAKLAEFAKLPTQAQAYRAASDYLNGIAPSASISTGSASGSGSSSTANNAGTTAQAVANVPPADRNWGNYYAKVNNPTEVSNFMNNNPGYITKSSGKTITGTKDGKAYTWIFDGKNWIVQGSTPAAANDGSLDSMKQAALTTLRSLNNGVNYASAEAKIQNAKTPAELKAIGDDIEGINKILDVFSEQPVKVEALKTKDPSLYAKAVKAAKADGSLSIGEIAKIGGSGVLTSLANYYKSAWQAATEMAKIPGQVAGVASKAVNAPIIPIK